jgi:hypothetical protein
MVDKPVEAPVEHIDPHELRHLSNALEQARIAALPFESFMKFLGEKYQLTPGKDQINPETGQIIRAKTE